jgi:hypothetical protein
MVLRESKTTVHTNGPKSEGSSATTERSPNMNLRPMLQLALVLSFVVLLAGCGGTPDEPTATLTLVPPTAAPTSVPPTATPTSLPATATPTPASPAATDKFPMGTYSARSGKYILEFGEERNYTFIDKGSVTAIGTFSINGNEYTVETDSYCDRANLGKATYAWHYEDSMLTFQLIEKDNCPARASALDGVTYHKEGEGVTIPVGTFTARKGDYVLEIGGDNSFAFSKKNGTYDTSGTFSTNEYEITWESDSYCAQENAEEATYGWTLENNVLSFRVIGSDPCGARSAFLLFAFAKEP